MALSVRPYTVRQGDTLSSIARKRGELFLTWKTTSKEVFRGPTFFLAYQASSLVPAPAWLVKQLWNSAFIQALKSICSCFAGLPWIVADGIRLLHSSKTHAGIAESCYHSHFTRLQPSVALISVALASSRDPTTAPRHKQAFIFCPSAACVS